MKFCECPYCKRDASSWWSFGNSAFMLNTQKECLHCLGRIKLDFVPVFLATFFIAIISFALVFWVGYYLHKDAESPLIAIVLFIIAYGVFYFQVHLYSKKFGLRAFLPKDDVKKHMDNLPSYLK